MGPGSGVTRGLRRLSSPPTTPIFSLTPKALLYFEMDVENAAPQAASVTSVLAAVKASPQPDLESLVRTDGDELAKMLECTELHAYAPKLLPAAFGAPRPRPRATAAPLRHCAPPLPPQRAHRRRRTRRGSTPWRPAWWRSSRRRRCPRR